MQILVDMILSYATVKCCVIFPCRDFETQDVAAQCGWSSTVATSEIVDDVHDLILAKKRIAKTQEISRDGIGFIIYKQLGLK